MNKSTDLYFIELSERALNCKVSTNMLKTIQ
jgi:hypothetical protein